MTCNSTRRAALGLFAGLTLAGCGGGPPAVAPDAARISAPAPAAAAPKVTEPALRATLAANPADVDALSRLSRLLWDAGRHEDGIAAIEGSRAAGVALPDSLVTALALHHDALGHTDEADSLAQVLERGLDDWSRAGSAVTFLRLRGPEFTASEAVARRALDANPTAANHNNLGIALLYAGRPVEARKSFLKANDLDPELPGPLYNLAIVDRFYRFDDDGARDWFRRYRALSDEDPDGLAELLSVDVASGQSNPSTREENP